MYPVIEASKLQLDILFLFSNVNIQYCIYLRSCY